MVSLLPVFFLFGSLFLHSLMNLNDKLFKLTGHVCSPWGDGFTCSASFTSASNSDSTKTFLIETWTCASSVRKCYLSIELLYAIQSVAITYILLHKSIICMRMSYWVTYLILRIFSMKLNYWGNWIVEPKWSLDLVWFSWCCLKALSYHPERYVLYIVLASLGENLLTVSACTYFLLLYNMQSPYRSRMILIGLLRSGYCTSTVNDNYSKITWAN